MNISVTNGFDLKVSQSISLNNEIEEFLKRGGEVRTVVGCTGVKKDFGYIGLEKKEQKPKKEKPVKKERKKMEKTRAMDNRNKKMIADKEARQAIQMPVLAEYKTWSGEYRWSELQRLTGFSTVKFTRIASGYNTFTEKEDWQSVLDAIAVLRSRHDAGEEIGTMHANKKSILAKEKRIKEQVKILSDFRESYKGRGAFARLEEKTGIKSSTFGAVVAKKTTIADHEKWKETLKAISELMENN